MIHHDSHSSSSDSEISIYSTFRVLVVDDEVTYRFALRRLIEAEFGAKVIEADGAQRMFDEILKRSVPDVIILDMQMPVIDGKEAFIRLREMDETKRVPVIACTAVSERPFIVEMVRLGITDYIIKPFMKELFLERMKKTFDKLISSGF